ncbi:Clavaminate synthase-like protein, partial [Clathrospora elynae]
TLIHKAPAADEIAALETIDLALLLSGDDETSARLFEVAQSPGMFYLNFSNYSKEFVSALPRMYALTDRFFEQCDEEKWKLVRREQPENLDRGFKRSDCDETFEMADDELLRGDLALPQIMDPDKELVKTFNRQNNAAALALLASLSKSLKASGKDVCLSQHHVPTSTSDTGLKLVSEPSLSKLAEVGENKHTDSGTFTILFYQEWGLHVFLSGAAAADGKRQKWAFAAPPQPGCALVNVANSLQRLSGGTFHSPLHRVTQPCDGDGKRYYLSYFLRPAHATQRAWEDEAKKAEKA